MILFRSSRVFRTRLAVLAFTFFSAVASAATVKVVGTDNNRGKNIWINVDGTATQDYAGAIVIQLNGSTTSMPVLCADLFTGISVATYTMNNINASLLDASDPTRGLRAAYLYVTQMGKVTNAVQGAALQLAIWDIVHDGGDGFSAGRIRSLTTGTNTTDVAVLNAAIQYTNFSLQYAANPTVRGSILRDTRGASAAQQLFTAPEPSMFVMLGLGLGLVGWRHVQNRKSPEPPVS